MDGNGRWATKRFLPRVAGHVELKPVAADLGFRLGYYPLRWLGGEFEVGVMPTRTEADARKALKRAVKDVLPASLTKPKRPKGRPAVGGVSRKEVAGLKVKAAKFLDGKDGLQVFIGEVQLTALTILLIDGLLGTEPWRAAGNGPHGGIISANARVRYLENATRLLEDLKKKAVEKKKGGK